MVNEIFFIFLNDNIVKVLTICLEKFVFLGVFMSDQGLQVEIENMEVTKNNGLLGMLVLLSDNNYKLDFKGKYGGNLLFFCY